MRSRIRRRRNKIKNHVLGIFTAVNLLSIIVMVDTMHDWAEPRIPAAILFMNLMFLILVTVANFKPGWEEEE